MKHTLICGPLVSMSLILSSCIDPDFIEPEYPLFEVTISEDLFEVPLDGRLLLMFSTNNKAEPRFQIKDGPDTQLLFGVDVEDWEPGTKITIDAEDFGYPIKNLSEIPEGKYYVQALLHKYETFNRGDGYTVKLPMDRGEGQQWNQAPGNLYHQPIEIDFYPKATQPYSIELNQEIPPIEGPADSDYIKHVRLKSELLSRFWGRNIYLGAHVLLPKGFYDHPEVDYPLAIMHGHFPYDFGGFQVEPPDTIQPCDYSERFGVDCYNHVVEKEAHAFYKTWTGPDFPRVVAIKIQHPNPYYDDSYAVNSANLGPYGDAITYELIPYIEERFRCIGEGWARFFVRRLHGWLGSIGSTGLLPR